MPTTLGYNADLKPWPFDPERAKALLAEAKADGVPVDTEIHIIGRSNQFPNATETMEAIMATLQDVGFNVSLSMYDVAVWVSYYVKPFGADIGPTLAQGQHDNSMGDPVFSAFVKYDTNGTHSKMSDPETDRLIAEATAATGDERIKLWQEMFARVEDGVIAEIPLFHMVGFTRVSPRLDFKPSIATNSELQLAEIHFKE